MKNVKGLYSARDAYQAIKALYSETVKWAMFEYPRFLTLHDVRVQIGRGGGADALAIDYWNAGDVHGFEIKTNRNDWLSEMASPAKSEPVRRFCDFWWLVVTGEGIIEAGELPKGWGLYIVEQNQGNGDLVLKCRAEAPKLKPEGIRGYFLGSIIKYFLKQKPEVAAQPSDERGSFETGFRAGTKSLRASKDREIEALKKLVARKDKLIERLYRGKGTK